MGNAGRRFYILLIFIITHKPLSINSHHNYSLTLIHILTTHNH